MRVSRVFIGFGFAALGTFMAACTITTGPGSGTDFDDFTSRALAYASDGVSPAAQANRARLRDAMNAGGLTVYKGEWWHFDTRDAYEKRPILNVPVN